MNTTGKISHAADESLRSLFAEDVILTSPFYVGWFSNVPRNGMPGQSTKVWKRHRWGVAMSRHPLLFCPCDVCVRDWDFFEWMFCHLRKKWAFCLRAGWTDGRLEKEQTSNVLDVKCVCVCACMRAYVRVDVIVCARQSWFWCDWLESLVQLDFVCMRQFLCWRSHSAQVLRKDGNVCHQQKPLRLSLVSSWCFWMLLADVVWHQIVTNRAINDPNPTRHHILFRLFVQKLTPRFDALWHCVENEGTKQRYLHYDMDTWLCLCGKSGLNEGWAGVLRQSLSAGRDLMAC